MLIIVVVDYVVLVLADDVHGREDIQSVVHSALHVFEVNLVANLEHSK